MIILADAHVHVYPCFDAGRMLLAGASRLYDLAESHMVRPGERVLPAMFLSETDDCDFFEELKRSGVLGDFSVESSGRHALLLGARKQGLKLLVLAGRQVNSLERLEFTALGTSRRFPGGLSWQELLRQIREAGAMPVLNWSPGKWMFGRRSIVRDILASEPPGTICLADTALRPRSLWPEPILHRAAIGSYTVLTGSDPFPFPGEEASFGRLASCLDIPGGDAESAGERIMKFISQPGGELPVYGRKHSLPAVLRRLLQLKIMVRAGKR